MDIITSMVNAAQDHADVADVMHLQVVDVLKTVERKYDEMKKKASAHVKKDGHTSPPRAMPGTAIFP
jgi:hypothetical protein